jgi:hypothetical protein
MYRLLAFKPPLIPNRAVLWAEAVMDVSPANAVAKTNSKIPDLLFIRDVGFELIFTKPLLISVPINFVGKQLILAVADPGGDDIDCEIAHRCRASATKP